MTSNSCVFNESIPRPSRHVFAHHGQPQGLSMLCRNMTSNSCVFNESIPRPSRHVFAHHGQPQGLSMLRMTGWGGVRYQSSFRTPMSPGTF